MLGSGLSPEGKVDSLLFGQCSLIVLWVHCDAADGLNVLSRSGTFRHPHGFILALSSGETASHIHKGITLSHQLQRSDYIFPLQSGTCWGQGRGRLAGQ